MSAGRAISNAVETQRIHRTMGLIEARKTLRGDLPRRMNAAMRSTISLMTSPEMAEAIRNAERLAAALQAIGEAKSASAQFALVVE